MRFHTSFLALFAALSIGLAGCDTADNEPELERELEVQQVDPEADVEVMPGGEVDVEVEPAVAE